MKKLSEDYKKGFNDGLEKALRSAKLVYDPGSVTFGDRNNFEIYYRLRDRFSGYGTVYIDRGSVMKNKKK